MEQLFWQSNEEREKFYLLILRNFLTQKSAGFCRAQNNSRARGSLKYFAWKRYTQPLLFAKISNVFANRTFPKGWGWPRSLTKISNASQKSSLFLGVGKGISGVIANRTFPKGCEWPSFLAKIFNAFHKSSPEGINEIWKRR